MAELSGVRINQWFGQFLSFRCEVSMNTMFLLLTLEGGGWEGVNGQRVLDDVFL
jgi:hypothetical protein